MSTRIVYMGSDAIACHALEQLAHFSHGELVAVYTQPDRPQGRRRKMAPCPVKAAAFGLQVPVFSPEKLGDARVVQQLRNLSPDLIVVFAYGQYIPSSITRLPSLGCINIHPSLLPKYRGASPIQYTLLNGDEVGGVTILHVSKKMDAGDIICQREVPVAPNDTTGSLSQRMGREGADLVCQAITQLINGTARAIPQNESEVIEVGKLTKAEGRIDWSQPARVLRNRVRAFNPWPSCYTDPPVEMPGPLKILQAEVEPGMGKPGEVLDVDGAGPLVAAGEDALRLLEVQPPGKKSMSGAAFLHGHAMQPGMLFR